MSTKSCLFQDWFKKRTLIGNILWTKALKNFECINTVLNMVSKKADIVDSVHR